MNIIYPLDEAFLEEGLDWAGDFMREQGIDFKLGKFYSESEIVIFWGCSNVPEKLPFPIKKLRRDAKDLIGEWLTKDEYTLISG